MKSVVAIVVTHNNEQTVTDCIQSLYDNGVKEVVVVDNNSGDSTVKNVEEFSGVVVMRNKDNKGFAAAVNQAAACGIASLADYLFCLNPDAALTGSIDGVVELFEENSKVGVIGLRLEDNQGLIEASSFGKEPSFTTLVRRKLFRDSRPSSGEGRVDWVSGGAMLIRRKAFVDVDGFDPQFFMYWEDVDFCRRMRAVGWQICLKNTIRVRHVRGGSLSDSRIKARLYDASADKYFKKHYSVMIWFFQKIARFLYRLIFPSSL